MLAGGEGSSLTNLEVLVTHARTPFPPAVGLRRCVRMRIPCCLFASGRRRPGCGSASRRSPGPRPPRRRSCRRLRRRALPAGTQLPCCYLHLAVQRHHRVIILHACLVCPVGMQLTCQRVYAMLVCGRQRGCGCACMRACMRVRTGVLAHITTTIPELACSHDKRCAPNLSGGARRSG